MNTIMSNKSTTATHISSLSGASPTPEYRPRRIPLWSDNQPSLNVGVIGHVAHGKSTLVHAISEMAKSMTINLGYANAKIFRCGICPRPSCYQSFSSKVHAATCQNDCCDEPLEFVRHVSFVDCPGHEALMATMLNGAATFDCALLVVAANEAVAPPQTKEHLAIVTMLELSHVLTVQSKLDLVSPDEAAQHHRDLRKFLRSSAAEDSPIIPISASTRANVDAVLMYICEQIPRSPPEMDRPARLDVIRSFDVNKPGTTATLLQGAVLGGSLASGAVHVGDELELRPGLVRRSPGGTSSYYPMRTRVLSLSSERNSLQTALPGGLIGIGTTLDPACGRSDGLVGSVIGLSGLLPPVWEKLRLSVRLLPHRLLVGDDVRPLGEKETLTLNIGASTVTATVVPKRTSSSDKGQKIGVRLNTPVCAEVGQRVSLSRLFKGQWRVVGMGRICKGSVPATELSYEQLAGLRAPAK